MTDVPGWPTFEEWRESLDPTDREMLDALTGWLRAAGAPDPEMWARSEVSEDIPQTAIFTFLRAVWRDLDRWRDPRFVNGFLEKHGLSDSEAARRLVGEVGFQATLDAVMVIDHGEYIDGPNGLPGWVLVETDADCRPTGRQMVGLHESFLGVDPRGIEAEDIRGW